MMTAEAYTPALHLRPIWRGCGVWDETIMFVGAEGAATLLYEPDGPVTVRDYRLSVTYREGVDYRIEGRRIYRLPDSSIPYWEPDEYFPIQPNDPNIRIGVDWDNLEYDFDRTVQRYIIYGEPFMVVDRQCAVTYTHRDAYTGFIPPDQSAASAPLLEKLRAGKPVSVMCYGDSVAVGCCASGTKYGGFINPGMPDYPHIVTEWIGQTFGVPVSLENQAVGGWRAENCLDEWDKRIAGKDIDLLMLRVGGNDSFTPPVAYKAQIGEMLRRFYAEHPEGVVLLQSAETPNPQSCWVGNQVYFEDILFSLAAEYPQTVVAPVYGMFVWMQSTGKRMRDFLGNNINHPNDFGIRVYVHTILRALFGALYDA